MAFAMPAESQAKCYQCGKWKPKEGFWFLHSPQDENYSWNLCGLSCLTERVRELREARGEAASDRPDLLPR